LPRQVVDGGDDTFNQVLLDQPLRERRAEQLRKFEAEVLVAFFQGRQWPQLRLPGRFLSCRLEWVIGRNGRRLFHRLRRICPDVWLYVARSTVALPPVKCQRRRQRNGQQNGNKPLKYVFAHREVLLKSPPPGSAECRTPNRHSVRLGSKHPNRFIIWKRTSFDCYPV